MLPSSRDRDAVEARAAALADREFVRRLWTKDPGLWSGNAEVQKRVRERLGWLDVLEEMAVACRSDDLLGQRIEAAGGERAILLGMGGSSLCPEVCRRVFGIDGFDVLDSTVPAAVRALGEAVDPARTLVIVSSKSGTTTETRVLADHFFARATPMLERPGERFVAVTDPGTPLAESAYERGFRRVWLNRPDIGGRYSALSYFGLVPMAVMGIDVGRVLDSAQRMARSCAPEVPVGQNPGVVLGLAMYRAWEAGRDKVTLLASERLEPFGMWVEQLIAESTGKEGEGLVPVHGEPLGGPASYGDDRMFVQMRFADEEGGPIDELADELAAGGRPVVCLTLDDPYDLGGEFFRWEIAVAVVGALMGINPFDEPNVGESKERTRELLGSYERRGALEEPQPVYREDGLDLYADLEADPDLAGVAAGVRDLAGWLRAHLGRAEVPDYIALQAFLAPDGEIEGRLRDARGRMREVLGVATTFGWGPRFLHSTGQLHKGGPDTGVFLQITAEDDTDVDCAGRPYSFGTLARAQALGDLQALQARGRRVLRVHLGARPRRGIERLTAALDRALRNG